MQENQGRCIPDEFLDEEKRKREERRRGEQREEERTDLFSLRNQQTKAGKGEREEDEGKEDSVPQKKENEFEGERMRDYARP